jgi:hypothetical protein
VKNEIDFKGAEMVNVNTETDIPYGYIAAATLDPEMVERLIYGAQAIIDANGNKCGSVSFEASEE